MFKSNVIAPAEQKLTAWIPSVVMLLAIIPILASSGQPAEVTATIFSAYVAVMSVVAAVVARKKGKRSLAIIAVSTSIIFLALFATYGYIAFGR